MARFLYSCAVGGCQVVKKPTGTNNEKSKIKAGLHGWACSEHGRGVKVIRTLNKEK